jgi:two-component system, NtrC family, response regulator HupR/HoxA
MRDAIALLPAPFYHLSVGIKGVPLRLREGQGRLCSLPASNCQLRTGSPEPAAPNRQRPPIVKEGSDYSKVGPHPYGAMTDEKSAPGTVLLVDDNLTVLETLRLCLEDAGFVVTAASGGREAIALCHTSAFDVVVCDVRMPDIDGIETLRAIKALHPQVRAVVITAYSDDPRTPVEAIGLGVDDYLLKPFDDRLLVHNVARNVERHRLGAENTRLQQELSQANTRLRQENSRLRQQAGEGAPFSGLIGKGPAITKVLTRLQAVLDSDITVLLSGETGTGKELAARGLHYGGARSAASFVPVHCGAVQESLLESELFGVIPHYPGLHSPMGKKGLLQEADGGTLFLDEVGETSPAMQVKLLRALQDGEILRIGDTRPITVDVRIIAATNRDLEAEVEAGRFREDLYFRLAGVDVALPPLRDRPEDLPLLTSHFHQLCRERLDRPSSTLTAEALQLLAGYHWPGNVRELEKEIDRATTLAGDGSIAPDHFSERLQEQAPAMPAVTGGAVTLAELERRHLEGVLALAKGSIGRAADILGIHRNTLSRKMTEYGLQPPEVD